MGETGGTTLSNAAAAMCSYTGKGITSRQEITVTTRAGAPGQGIVFEIPNPKSAGEKILIPARAESVVNTLRNVTLGKESARLCIVEHYLAAVALWGLEDLTTTVDGPEMPLGDGSANFWIDMLSDCAVASNKENWLRIDLPEPVQVCKGDRSIIAIPDSQFSVSYLMDWNHPMIGKRWQTWSPSQPIAEVTDARTFGSMKEHEMLGLTKDVVSLTEDGFTSPLRFEDEPVRHKLLDLIGDLTLIGFNPLRLNARIISIKGGHELDVQIAKKLIAALNR
ncbi:MAG TPA: UDP-3-O-acyl-N-acetylglucosamine deacetylase [Planktothrix sp.]|jgi:UDP-3-O-[3-hydroxymyristoyl] N-acetylglucosamine deacetylase